MLTQLTATPIFQRLAYDEFYCKGLYDSLFSRSLSRTPSKKTQRSESDDSINLDEKKTRQKNPVKDYDSLTGMSKNNGSTVSESHVTKSTFGVDDESIIETGRGKRNRKKKKDPEFEYFG